MEWQAAETTSPISRPRPVSNRLLSMLLRRAGNRGFTFVELIFIVALIAIVAAVSIPQFKRSFDSLMLQNFISDFTAFAGYAQAKAVSGGSEVRINIDLPQKRLLTEDHIVSQDDSDQSLEAWAAGKERLIPDSVSVDLKGGSGKVTFYPDGTSDKAEFVIGGKYDKKYAVSVEPGTGYVNVKQTE